MIFRSSRSLFSYLLLLLAVVGLNLTTEAGINLWVLCFLPIGLATWNLGGRSGSLLLLVAAIGVAVQAVNGGLYTSRLHLVVSVGSKILALALVVWLIARLRVQEVGRLFVPGKPPTAKK